MTSSADHSPIPVKNIYYMLVYAWDHPHEKEFIQVLSEDEKDLLHLLSKVLLLKVKALIKKGFYKEYAERQEKAAVIRGKILFKETIATMSHRKGRLHILEEEMSYNILHNQLIKATLFHLARSARIDGELQDELHMILPYFGDISLIQPTSRRFREAHVHRNNQQYRFILHICELIWEQALLHEGENEKQFQDVSRDHRQMARLFESFVKNFYRTELPGAQAKSETLDWPAKGEQLELLPQMRTDISLTYASRKLIIDTKFYKETFEQFWGTEKIHSAHLYQLFSYLKADEHRTGQKAGGMLLYPNVNRHADLEYQIHEFSIQIRTLDLTLPWRKIHERLLGFLSGI